MAAALHVTEPIATGIGGDAFALVYQAWTGEVKALNACGRAPRAMTRDYFARRGLSRIPSAGMACITVPGAFDGWVTSAGLGRADHDHLSRLHRDRAAADAGPSRPARAQHPEGLRPDASACLARRAYDRRSMPDRCRIDADNPFTAEVAIAAQQDLGGKTCNNL